MGAAVIDKNTLNSLFENQEKLDDLFDSIFDDGNYFISSESSSHSLMPCPVKDEVYSFTPTRSRPGASLPTTKRQSPYFFVLPVALELAIIYFVVTHWL